MIYRGKTGVMLFSAVFSASVFLAAGCSAEASKPSPSGNSSSGTTVSENNLPENESRGATIEILPNSPADTVREFYKRLREKRFREAIFLTNLRPAIEGLSDDELREFQVDLEAIARNVPPQIEINGEVISEGKAIVTARLPDEDQEKMEVQEIRLRRDGENWVILSVDETAEKRIKKEGANYFYALRIETHEAEAKAMLERLHKAQLAYSLQNGGAFTSIDGLIEIGYLPPDIKTSDSTGYHYSLFLTPDRKSYYASAIPAQYGKSGVMSYVLELNGTSLPVVTGRDNNGKPLR
ncbi:MAG TPA: hypothetical protein DEA22_06070 [Blastocatellia bacterium]|nr:hypothetical protein [Blastocatellia bacterium]